MKGIILAGGSGTRLYPLTLVISKQLLPVYNKPMIYYPLSTLMLAGIREILIISTPQDIAHYERLLGDGTELGICLQYAVQPSPDGLAQAFIIGETFIGSDSCAMILGDNIFYGNGLSDLLQAAAENHRGATIFGCYVHTPGRFGVLGFDTDGKVSSIEEKPENPKSDYAVTGLYFYDSRVTEYAKTLKPSERGELEITDLNCIYLENDELDVRLLGRGYTWLDTGSCENLLGASNFIKLIEERQGVVIAAPEEIAYNKGWITRPQLVEAAQKYRYSDYGRHLLRVADGQIFRMYHSGTRHQTI